MCAYHHKLPAYDRVVKDRTRLADQLDSPFRHRFLDCAWGVWQSHALNKPKTIVTECLDEQGQVEWLSRKRNKSQENSIRRKYSNLNVFNLNLLDSLLVLLPLSIIHDLVTYCAFNAMFPEPLKNLRSNCSIEDAYRKAVKQVLGDTPHEYIQYRVQQMFQDVSGELFHMDMFMPVMGIPCVALHRRFSNYPTCYPVGAFPEVRYYTHLIQQQAYIGENTRRTKLAYQISRPVHQKRVMTCWTLIVMWMHQHVVTTGFRDLIRLSMTSKGIATCIQRTLSQSFVRGDWYNGGRVAVADHIAKQVVVHPCQLPKWKDLFLLPIGLSKLPPKRNDCSQEEDTDPHLLRLQEAMREIFSKRSYTFNFYKSTNGCYEIII
jgi:hypothetical protein